MSAFDLELALDRLEAELAAELPSHVRAFATAYAGGSPIPTTPATTHRRASLDLARRALDEPALAPRGLALLRLLAPIAIEDDPVVSAARDAVPSWTGLAALAAARDAATARLNLGAPAAIACPDLGTCAAIAGPDLGAPAAIAGPDLGAPAAIAGSDLGTRAAASANPDLSTRAAIAGPDLGTRAAAIAGPDLGTRAAIAGPLGTRAATALGRHAALMVWLHGCAVETGDTREVVVPPAVDGWHDRTPAIPAAFVERAWRDLADRHGASGRCRIASSPTMRPRTFVVAPGEAIVVLGSIDTPAMRFAVLHELGHALGALLSPVPLPRVVDEALAAYTGRLVEREGDLDLPWFVAIGEAARVRRGRLSQALAAVECAAAPLALERPPWALWHDPGAQAAYVAAEAIAERWWRELGPTPPRGALRAAIAAEHERIDRETLSRRP